MTDKECIFCKIAGGEIPSSTVYEDEDFRVILDLGPASKGHALILPKQHFKDLSGDCGKSSSISWKDWCGDEESTGLHGFQCGSEQWHIRRTDCFSFPCTYYSEI